MTFAYGVIVAINAVGSLILEVLGLVARFFKGAVRLIAAGARRAGELVVYYRKPLLAIGICGVLLLAGIASYRYVSSLPNPKSAEEILKNSQITVYDKTETPLYQVRSSQEYQALLEDSPHPVSDLTASRQLAQLELTGPMNKAARRIGREIVAAKIRARLSPIQISALYRAILPPQGGTPIYKRAPLPTDRALAEATRILGASRVARGGFSVYTTIDLSLFNNLQQQLLTEVAEGALPNGEIVVTRAPDGTISSMNTRQLPFAHMQVQDFDTSLPLISKIVAANGQILYRNDKLQINNLGKGGDLYGN